MASCDDPKHAAAMAAHASLSRTQFGRAALERHGHDPMKVEAAQDYEAKASKGKTKNG